MENNYLDFELEIGKGNGSEYPIAVVSSPAGEARETMNFPFKELELRNCLKDLQIALLKSGRRRRRIPCEEEKAVQNFGQKLFDALFSGEIRSLYDLSLREATQIDKGLRIKLRIQSPEIAALPWEFLYDLRYDRYLCLSRETPIVRYIELIKPIRPLAVKAPLQILGMIASPNDLPVLDVNIERQRVEEAIKELEDCGLVHLTWLEGQTWRNLQKEMRRGPWNIFYFIGHGGFDSNTDEGFIALEDEDGKAFRLGANKLGLLLRDHKPLCFVILNSCEGAKGSQIDVFSSTAATLVRSGIPAVLAMQYEITDIAAIEFARSLYEALAEGIPVDAAVTEARKAINLAAMNTVEWGTPVLYMRSLDGVLFDIEQQAPTENKKDNTKSNEANQSNIEDAGLDKKHTLGNRDSKKEYSAISWKNRGDILYNQGKYEDVIECYDMALKLNPTYTTAYYNKGLMLYNQGKYDKAIECYNEAIRLDPLFSDALVNKGLALYAQGRYNEAIEYFDQGINLNPKDAGIWINKGAAFYTAGKYEDAIKCYEKAIEINPSNENAWINKGVILSDRGDYEEAINNFNKAIDLNPSFPSAWLNKGIALSRLDRNDESLPCFDMAIEQNPSAAEAWTNKGLALNKKEDYEQASRCFEKAIELNPSLSVAWYNKGIALIRLRRNTEADTAFARAKKLGFKAKS